MIRVVRKQGGPVTLTLCAACNVVRLSYGVWSDECNLYHAGAVCRGQVSPMADPDGAFEAAFRMGGVPAVQDLVGSVRWP